MVLNVADFYFEIGELRSESAKALCADYICGDPPRIDADVRLTQADVDAEAEAARRASCVWGRASHSAGSL